MLTFDLSCFRSWVFCLVDGNVLPIRTAAESIPSRLRPSDDRENKIRNPPADIIRPLLTFQKTFVHLRQAQRSMPGLVLYIRLLFMSAIQF
jgi:hypothetical protein